MVGWLPLGKKIVYCRRKKLRREHNDRKMRKVLVHCFPHELQDKEYFSIKQESSSTEVSNTKVQSFHDRNGVLESFFTQPVQ